MSFRLLNVDGRAALQHGEYFFDLNHVSGGQLPSCPMEAIARFEELSAVEITNATASGTVDPRRLGPPSPSPQKVFGIGLNYRLHAEESNMEIPTTPVVFGKFSSCLTGPAGDVVIRGERVDYEVELVVVLGKECKDVDEGDAWSMVAGVTCGQDISDRRVQMGAKPPQFDLGKSFDTYGPLGPAIVSLDQIADPDAIPLACDINGETRQSSNSSDLIFSVPYLISYLSRITTLLPGDLIYTGTPSGVGSASGQYLSEGDVITTRIEGVGEMTNRVVAG